MYICDYFIASLITKWCEIPKTIIKMVQTASLHMYACVRVGVWQCSPTV